MCLCICVCYVEFFAIISSLKSYCYCYYRNYVFYINAYLCMYHNTLYLFLIALSIKFFEFYFTFYLFFQHSISKHAYTPWMIWMWMFIMISTLYLNVVQLNLFECKYKKEKEGQNIVFLRYSFFSLAKKFVLRILMEYHCLLNFLFLQAQ